MYNLLATPKGRKILFAVLYFSEGAPIGFLWWAFPTYLRTIGVEVETITLFTSVLAIPWSIKFLWSPFIDRCKRIKGIILAAQGIMIITLIPLMLLHPIEQAKLLLLILICHALAASTQDAAIDALCIRYTPKDEFIQMNAWMQGGILTGRAVFGGGALFFISPGDNFTALTLLIAAISIPAIILCSIRELENDRQEFILPTEHLSLLRQLCNLVKSNSMRRTLCFALISGAAFESVGAVAGPFLIDSGFSKETVGAFFSLPVVFCMLVGTSLSALCFRGVSSQVALRWALISMVSAVILMALSAQSDLNGETYLPLISLAILYITVGLFTTSSYSYFMSRTEKSSGATEFSALMATTNMCEIGSTMIIGRLIPLLGYGLSFFVMALVSLCSLGVLSKNEQKQER